MGAAQVTDGKLVIDEEKCNNCGRCIGKCPFHAADEGTYGYKVYIGGRWEREPRTDRRLTESSPVRKKYFPFWKRRSFFSGNREIRESVFADTVTESALKRYRSSCWEMRSFPEKREIVGASLHLKGGATC